MAASALQCRLVAVAGTAALAAGAFGLAVAEEPPRYRQGATEVLVPRESGPESGRDRRSAILKDFHEAYRRVGSPRMTVFWNRMFSDRLSDMESEFRLVYTRDTVARTTGGGKGSETSRHGESNLFFEKRKDDTRSAFSEPADFRFEADYSRPFLEAGTRLIDRNTIMRLTHARGVADKEPVRGSDNRQLLETEALQGFTELVVQLLMTPSGSSELGTAVQVKVIDVASGEVKAAFFSDGDFREEAASKWVAAEGGYVRVTEGREAGGEDIGGRLALRTMSELVRAWRQP